MSVIESPSDKKEDVGALDEEADVFRDAFSGSSSWARLRSCKDERHMSECREPCDDSYDDVSALTELWSTGERMAGESSTDAGRDLCEEM